MHEHLWSKVVAIGMVATAAVVTLLFTNAPLVAEALSQPSPRAGAAMAYDPLSRTVILFGGSTPAGDVFADTWSWNGFVWTQLFPATSPTGRTGATLAYDAPTGRLVLYGGTSPTQFEVLSDTWTWDGTTWTQETTTGPAGGLGALSAYFPPSHSVLLYAGVTGTRIPPYPYLWSWNGSDWTMLDTFYVLLPAPEGGLVYDAATRTILAFGGAIDYQGELLSGTNTTGTFDGTTWTIQSPAHAPSARDQFAMTYDAARQVALLFGGDDASGVLDGDTWTWNGTDWILMQPLRAPAPRSNASSAYDPLTRQVVLFGGVSATGVDGDTWVWNGITWRQR
jgi:hypothetical protein